MSFFFYDNNIVFNENINFKLINMRPAPTYISGFEMCSHINSRDLPKPVGRTATISLSISKYSKYITWSGFKQNDGKLQRVKAYRSRLNTDSFSAILIFHYEYANLANLLHPEFQGVRWTRDQPMPLPFPAPHTSREKPWERGWVCDYKIKRKLKMKKTKTH